MARELVENYRIISIRQLVRVVQEGRQNAERFCFIIGAGASASSGIPTGAALEYAWMEEMEEDPGLKEIRAIAETLQKGKHLDHNFRDIVKAWEEAKASNKSIPSEFYFDIYKLRFFPNHRNGYHYLERTMADKRPSFGYHPLALMLTDGSGSNLVITTNFDSLLEDALFLYTNSKPLVINHELLADYAGDPNIKRPIIAKVHRGIFFDPLNRPEETSKLKGQWHDVLASVFQSYTPIVIVYGGGDNSLMDLLAEESVKMKNGIYWCYLEEDGIPGPKIQQLVQDKKGYLVRTAGFDAAMLAFGNALFPDRIGVHEAEEYLNRQTSMYIENYEKEYSKLTSYKEDGKAEDTSKSEFRKEVEKIEERREALDDEREKSDTMTAWDYLRQGNQHYYAGEFDRALESYSNAIQKQEDAPFYTARGWAYNCLHKYQEALSDFNQAIAAQKEYALAYNGRAFTYLGLKEYEQGISDCEKAILLKPDMHEARYHCGQIWFEKGNMEQAVSYFTQAITLNPKYKRAYTARAKAYRQMGQIEKAEADEQKAKTL